LVGCVRHGAGQEAVCLVVGVPQHFLDGHTQVGVPAAGCVQSVGALRCGQREQLVENPFDIP
jgi:hypothetical protein